MEVPVEILRAIFLSTLRNTNAVHPSDFDPPYSTPLYVSHVCRRWRQVSLSFRELWSYFALDFTGDIGSKQRKFAVKLFDACLQRTNGCALNFRFSCSSLFIETGPAADYIIRTLLSQQRRWRDVWFHFHFCASENYLAIDLNDMPSLMSLSFSVRTHHPKGYLVPVRLNIARSLLLEHLEINGVGDLEFDREATFASLRFSGIVFSAEQWEEENAARLCFDLLKASPSLKDFDAEFGPRWIAATRPTSSPLSEEDTYVMHNMLRLTLWGGIEPAFVIEKLTLPNLVYLRYGEGSHENGTEILSRFFQRSLPPLQSLRLSGSCAEEAIIVPLLRFLPELQELRMMCPNISAWFFEELARGVDPSKSDDPPLCPALRSLHLERIHISNSVYECAEALFGMAWSRKRHLKTFKGIWSREAGVIEIPESGLYTRELVNCIGGESLGYSGVWELGILITDDVEKLQSTENNDSDDSHE